MDDDGWKSVRPFLQQKKLNYPVVLGNQDLAKLYGVDSLPVTLLIDREGKIADSHSGMVDKTTLSVRSRRSCRKVNDPDHTSPACYAKINLLFL
jgi:hypothetical protein